MHHFQTLCRLQLHKLASEQMHGDAALIEFFHLTEASSERDDQTRRGDRNTSSTHMTGENLSSGNLNQAARQDTKERPNVYRNEPFYDQ